jgi:hypothetical protein
MRINVKVTPNAKVPELSRISDTEYRAKVNARASEGKANIRLIEMLADHFNVTKSHIQILKGLKSREKVIDVIV